MKIRLKNKKVITGYKKVSFMALSIISICLYSQPVNLKFNHLTLKEGLHNLRVQAITQDKYGFIWIGTEEGLHKFDSYEFKYFLNDRNSKSSIRDNNIRDLVVDDENNLWVGTDSGLDLFDRKSETFTHIPLVIGSDTLPRYVASTLHISYDKNIFIGPSQQSIYRLNKSKRIVESYPVSSIPAQNIVYSSDKLGNLWIASTQGVYKFNPSNGEYDHYEVNGKSDRKISSNFILDILVDSKNNVWIATSNGLNRIDIKTGSLVIYNLLAKTNREIPGFSVTKIYEDNNQHIWFTSEHGLFRYEEESDSFTSFFSDNRDNTRLSTNRINCVFVDKQGILWVGTQTMGVDFTPLNDPFHFENIYAGTEIREEYGINAVTEIFKEKNGNTWIATDGSGINYIDYSSGKRKIFSNNKQDPGSIRTNSVLSIVEDSEGIIWLGGFFGGINKFDRVNETFESFSISDNGPIRLRPFSNEIKFMIEGNEGELLIATNGSGLVIFNTVLHSFKFILNEFNNPNSLCSNFCTTLLKDSFNNIWIGTYNGLSKWNRASDRFTNYFFNQEISGSLPGNSVSSLYEDSDKNIWIGTNDGLCMLNSKTEIFDYFTTKDGLLNESINDVLEDDEGNVWVCTNNGLSRIDKNSRLIRPYNFNPEFHVSQFSKSCSFKDTSGNLYFGLTHGFLWFNPDDVDEISDKNPLYITEFHALNNNVEYIFPESDLGESGIKVNIKKVELTHDQSFVTFKYVALNYLYPFQTNYAYILEGFDNDWHYAGNERSATYTNLSPGRYLFKVKTGSESRGWDFAVPAVEIRVHPPIWKTGWAFSLYAVAFFSGLIAVLRFYKFRNEIKKQVEIERIKAEEQHKSDMFRLQFFTNVSHEIRTPLTLILGPAEQLKNNVERNGKSDLTLINIIHQNSVRLLELVNQLLDFRKLGSGKESLNLVYEDIVEHISKVITLFQPLAQNRNINLAFHPITDSVYTCFDSEKLQRIISNLVSNAIKFTPENGTVQIIVDNLYPSDESGRKNNESQILKSHIRISVKDNGIGINDFEKTKIFNSFYQVSNNNQISHGGFGIGLAMTREYVRMHNGIITVKDNKSSDTSKVTGTEFEVLLPVVECSADVSEKEKLILHRKGTSDYLSEYDSEADQKSIIQLEGNIPTILIVEDNPDMRFFIKEELSGQFYVIDSIDGKKGYETALKTIPDLIITDYLMPEVSGVELCRLLKTNIVTSHIPVILLTALSEDQFRIEGLETGADDYIIKPFNSLVLKARIKNLINTRKQLQEKYLKNIGFKNEVIASNSIDQKFLDNLFDFIEKELDNPELEVNDFTREIGMSKTQLYKKIKALTGQTLFEFINTVRLKRGAEILLKEDITISEVAQRVGFSSLSVFTRSFSRFFKISPTQYVRTFKSDKNMGGY